VAAPPRAEAAVEVLVVVRGAWVEEVVVAVRVARAAKVE
jgi:hypothetical protein